MSFWKTVSKIPLLKEDEVHVWMASLERGEDEVKKAWHILSPREKVRAARFTCEKHQERFILSHAILHAILSKYLPDLTTPLQFSHNRYGKPHLLNKAIKFNLSHSHELALYAVSLNREVGIDIQYMKDEVQIDAIAQRFFSPQEVALLELFPSFQKRRLMFYRIWALKEAYVKAIGQGLSFPFRRFSVSELVNREGSKRPIWVRVDSDANEAESCTLYITPSIKSYAAALSVQGAATSIKYFSWIFSIN